MVCNRNLKKGTEMKKSIIVGLTIGLGLYLVEGYYRFRKYSKSNPDYHISLDDAKENLRDVITETKAAWSRERNLGDYFNPPNK
jgi:hypothetical protein